MLEATEYIKNNKYIKYTLISDSKSSLQKLNPTKNLIANEIYKINSFYIKKEIQLKLLLGYLLVVKIITDIERTRRTLQKSPIT